MSSLRVNAITDTSGGSTNLTVSGKNTAKAWVNFNGTGTVAIRSQFNVSSITDNGTGDYTVNFASALADANYCVNLSNQTNPADGPDAPTTHYARTPNTTSTPTSSSFRVSVMNLSGTAKDRDYMSVTIFGN